MPRVEIRMDVLAEAQQSSEAHAASPVAPMRSERGTVGVNITEKGDDEILAMADRLWRHLIEQSNAGKYGEFVKHFSSDLARAMNQVVAGHQFANSELARNLSDDFDPLGIIRRGEHVTVVYRQRSSKKAGEWLGRLVLGYEHGEVRIFGASIF